MKRLIFYDLDGTLVDTREDITAAANFMLAEFRKPALSSGKVGECVGRGLHYLIKSCLETEDAKLIEKGSKIYRAHYKEHMLDHSRLYPGAKKILDYFKKRKQAVITNKPNPYSRDILTALGVADYFTDIIAGDTDSPKKPDPAAVRAILTREKISPSESLLVGDSVIDIETARNAKVPVAVVLHGFSTERELKSAGPDAIAKDFGEMLEIAKKERW